ncbi:uncharacterized protein LOC123547190 isoform X2 [Mercenaria mercenaria]|uniref:uncharacterized protein LOC123547190 isoform X2 n=1 Tax=Mercenaria mercenaria TaxID=6596 RepID=UPI00234F0C83|nr:uncharacterized protein LOC123547190 isoform X2 [Mercenaria mercenaria]
MLVKTKSVFCIFALGIIVYFVWIVKYLIEEFGLRTHTHTDITCPKERINLKIPGYIHQVFFSITSQNLEEHHLKRINSWKKNNVNYTHVLWNESAVIDLIKNNHPNLLRVYHSYSHWIQRTDMARYVILYNYGGWYIDLDIACKRRLDELADRMLESNKSVVLHLEKTAGPSNDFMGITAHHPFMKTAIDWLPFSNKWFFIKHTTIMLSTGPTFLFGRYLNYPCSDDILILSLESFAKYVYRFNDGSWYGIDSQLIYYILGHRKSSITIALFIVLIMITFCVAKLQRRWRVHRRSRSRLYKTVWS